MSHLESQLFPPKGLFEGFDDEAGNVDESLNMPTQGWTDESRVLSDRYIEGKTALQAQVGVRNPFESEAEQFQFVIQKIGFSELVVKQPCGREQSEISFRFTGDRTGKMHLTMSIESSKVVDRSKEIVYAQERRSQSFLRVVRLYRLSPSFQFIREWLGIESRCEEFFIVSEHRKVKTAFIGGRIGRSEVVSVGKMAYREPPEADRTILQATEGGGRDVRFSVRKQLLQPPSSCNYVETT